MKPIDCLPAIAVLALGAVTTYGLALLGNPEAVWLCAMLGVPL